MIDLELLGTGADDQTLVFTDTEGVRYHTPITDELRGLIRRDKPSTIAIAPVPSGTPLSPRDIQRLLRAGNSPEDIARTHGIDITHVQRFEGPVQAEKDYVLTKALDSVVGGAPDGPVMGDLVIDRLAARGVDPAQLSWSARRDNGPWEIGLIFIQAAVEHGARWSFANGHVEAIDQEARWLTETPTAAAPLITPLDVAAATGNASADDLQSREALIDQLNAARGGRADIDIPLGDDDSEDPFAVSEPPVQTDSISAQIYSLAHARAKTATRDKNPDEVSTDRISTIPSIPGDSADSHSTGDADHQALPGMEGLTDAGAPPKKKTRRRSVPSWDEIVFGSKN